MSRIAELRQLGVICDESIQINGEVTLEPPVRLWPRCSLRNCSIGAFSYAAGGCALFEVSIGRYSSIGDNLATSIPRHPTSWLSTSPFFYQDVFGSGLPNAEPDLEAQGPVRIGNDVWIGSKVTIKGGVGIGDGAIVGLGAIVTKDVEPYTIVGGIPAKPIRKRFDDALIADLLDFKWWRYDLTSARRGGLEIDWRNPAKGLEQMRAAESAGRLDLIPEGRTVTLSSARR